MEELKLVPAWSCGHCGEIHRTSLQAKVCCGNKFCVAEYAYICPTCGEAHWGLDDAVRCCDLSRTIDALRTENARLKERCEAYRELVEALERANSLDASTPLTNSRCQWEDAMNLAEDAHAKLAALEE